MTSKIVLVLAGALSGTLLLAALQLPREPSGGSAEPAPSRAAASASALEAAVAALEAENAALRDRLDAIDQRLEEADVNRDQIPISVPRPEERVEETVSEPAREESPEAHLASLEDAFRAGARDVPGSLDLEASLRSALDELELSPGVLASSECGAALCRVELTLASGPDRDHVLRRIPDLIPWESDGFASEDPADPDLLIVYLTPEGGGQLP